jgi:hypothetical protein
MKKTIIKSLDEYRKHVYRNLQASQGDLDVWEGFDTERIARVEKYIDSGNLTVGRPPEDDIKYYFDSRDSDAFREAFDLIESWAAAEKHSHVVDEAYGLIRIYDCYDYDDDGNEIDEDGNIIEDDNGSPEALKFESWVHELTYPFMLIEWVDSTWDRVGDGFICGVEFVELSEFGS